VDTPILNPPLVGGDGRRRATYAILIPATVGPPASAALLPPVKLAELPLATVVIGNGDGGIRLAYRVPTSKLFFSLDSFVGTFAALLLAAVDDGNGNVMNDFETDGPDDDDLELSFGRV